MGCACSKEAHGEKLQSESRQSDNANRYGASKEADSPFEPKQQSNVNNASNNNNNNENGGGGDETTGGNGGRDPQSMPLLESQVETSTGVESTPTAGRGGQKSKSGVKTFITNIVKGRERKPTTTSVDEFNDINSTNHLSPTTGSGGQQQSAAGTSSSPATPANASQPSMKDLKNSGKEKSKLALNTYNLLCSQHEFVDQTSTAGTAGAGADSCGLASLKQNREIQAYLSMPYSEPSSPSSSSSSSRSSSSSQHNQQYQQHQQQQQQSYWFKLMDRHVTHTLTTPTTTTAGSVYDNLRQYCTQRPRNLDFSVVNLNYNLNPTALTTSSSKSSLNLAANKYFRRALGRLVLTDLLNYTNNSASLPPTPHSYMTPNGLFIIFLSESQVEQETLDDVLCPERIEASDYKSHLERKLSKHELELFNKWYKPVDMDSSASGHYRLEIDFAASHGSHTRSMSDDLNKLVRILNAHFIAANAANSDSPNDDLRLKYLKSVQQDELELLSRGVADPNMIVWLHLVSPTAAARSDETQTTTTEGGNMSELNKARYTLMFDVLKDRVLNHNYKQIRINTDTAADETPLLTSQLDSIVEFLFNSIKQLVDGIYTELDKASIGVMSLKIDKHLALEIYKHYQYFKYLRGAAQSSAGQQSSGGGVAAVSTLSNIENKFITLLNEYLGDPAASSQSSAASRSPLMIYNNESSTSGGLGDEAASSYFDRFTAKWMSRLGGGSLGDTASPKSTTTTTTTNRLVVYRFCNHTILASEVLTLLQSIVHQLCYILDVHESLAFESPWKMCENLCKSLNHYFSKPENRQKQIVLVLTSLDRCLKSTYDVSLLLGFMSRLFGDASNTWPSASCVRVVLTVSVNSTTSSSTSKLVNTLHKKLDSLFAGAGSCKPTCKLNIEPSGSSSSSSRRSSLAAATSVLSGSAWSSLNEQLTSLLFGSNADPKSAYLVDLLVYFLHETRYGVKQAEISDFFRTLLPDTPASPTGSSSSSQTVPGDSNLRAFLLDTVWYTLKYYGRLFSTLQSSSSSSSSSTSSSSSSSLSVPTSLLSLCTDQSQTLFKLAVANLGSAYQIKRANKNNKFDEIIYSYYNRSSASKQSAQSSSSDVVDKSLLRLVSYFNVRIFHELPRIFYLSDSADPQEDQAYMNEFILNPKWLLNKSFTCSSVLYYLHDLASYRKLFMSSDECTSDDLAAISPTDTSPSEETASSPSSSSMSSKKKFLRFERVVYKVLFNLSQDQNQFEYFVRTLGMEALLTNPQYLSTRSSSLSPSSSPPARFTPLNYEYFKLKDSLDKSCLLLLGSGSDLGNEKSRQLVHFNKVVFVQRGIFLTLSEAPYNFIKIWKVDQDQPIRTIKLNKSPKDIRLISHHTAVVLIDRNLHLIDLNQCEHIYDLNCTMHANFAHFELHDANHLVLLARNRLSVILMRIPHISTTQSRKSSQAGDMATSSSSTAVTTVAPPGMGGKLTIAKDDMFLFKVGEDRYLKSLTVSRNGKIMVCGDEVQKPFPLLVWNLNQRKLVYDLRQANHEIIVSIQAISTSGRYFVSACQEEGETKNCLIVYDLSTGQLFKKLKAKSDYICVEVSEESEVIIACLENAQILVYDLLSGSKKFSINSNRFPINKIKLIDDPKQPNRHLKNYFITYDTTGCDWTVRLWDLQVGDQLVSAITMPSRIISLDVNTSPFYLEQTTTPTPTPTTSPVGGAINNQRGSLSGGSSSVDYETLMAVSLYGVKEVLVVRLDLPNPDSTRPPAKASLEPFSTNDAILNGLIKEINL